MRFTAQQYASALHDILQATAPSEVDNVLDNFVKVLAENNDLRMFDQIASEFRKQDFEEKGIKEVEVVSAHNLNHENEKRILDLLNKYVGGKVKLYKKIDETLVGGVLINIDDMIIDASVKNSLEQLRKDIEK